jgi:holliday junction DNA helicase RuvB
MIMPAATCTIERERDDVIELVPDLDATKLDARLRAANRRTDVGHRELSFYLAEMQDRGLYQMLGYANAIEYACRTLLLNKRTAQELITVGRALAELELVDEAFCSGRLRWSQVRLLVRIAVKETQAAWVERALTLSWNEFDREVATSEKGRPPRQDRKGIPQVKIVIRGKVSRLDYETWELTKKKLEAERGEPMSDADCMAYAGRLILSTRADGTVAGRERLRDSIYRTVMQVCPSCESRTLQTPEGPAEISDCEAERLACDAKTPSGMREKVLVRDGFMCRACKTRIDLHAHHVIWRSKKGPTTPWNLVTLCDRCHGLVHEGLLLVSGKAPNGVSITDRHGKPLDSAGAITGLKLRNLRIEAQAEASRAAAAGEGATPSSAPAEPAEMTIARIPGRFDLPWFRRHVNLFSFPEGGEARFKPGLPITQTEVDSMRAESGATAAGDAGLAQRPQRFADVIGQQRAVRALEVAAKSARKRNAAVEHVLLLGQAGLGKTTLAEALANELGTRVHRGNAALIQDPWSLVRLLANLEDKDVVFLDELHALPKRAMEALYDAMEDGRIRLMVTDGHVSKLIELMLPRFTLVGATTEIGRLTEPFVSRFPIREHLSPYARPDLAAIVARAAAREAVAIDADATGEIATAARGVPRQAIGLLLRVRDEVLFSNSDRIDRPSVARALVAAGIDENGLQPVERQALDCLVKHGRPLGVSRWAALSGLPVATLRRLCEPELLRLGLIDVTPRGRIARAQLRAIPEDEAGAVRYAEIAMDPTPDFVVRDRPRSWGLLGSRSRAQLRAQEPMRRPV